MVKKDPCHVKMPGSAKSEAARSPKQISDLGQSAWYETMILGHFEGEAVLAALNVGHRAAAGLCPSVKRLFTCGKQLGPGRQLGM